MGLCQPPNWTPKASGVYAKSNTLIALFHTREIIIRIGPCQPTKKCKYKCI